MAKQSVKWGGEKRINLALQGGGSHGAFTWGVLDAILEDGRLDIEAITGTSAGAMNAVALVHGYLENGREGARAKLAQFWSGICEDARLNTSQRELLDTFLGAWRFENSPLQAWFDFWASTTSPYSLNPLNINPLRELLERDIDFEKVRACKDIKLFVAATNVHTGRIAVFDRDQLTVDHVMASACLPTVFQAVEIDGVPYWDGGYMGNPALFPLFYNSETPDILIVQINPVERKITPQTPRDIQNRLNEITFNGALLGELRAIEFVNRLVDSGKLQRSRGLLDRLRNGKKHAVTHDYMRPFIHRIDGADEIAVYPASTKFDTRWSFLTQLRDIGRTAAQSWLKAHYEAIGERDTLDLTMAYQNR